MYCTLRIPTISSGGLFYLNEPDCGIDWKSIFSLPHINMAAVHVYSDHDRNITMPMVAQWASNHLKPFMVPEQGPASYEVNPGTSLNLADRDTKRLPIIVISPCTPWD